MAKRSLRDIFVRTLYGGRVSLMVGVVATAVSLAIGVTYGAVAGYFGGRVDALMMRIVDILYAMPFMFFVILLMVFFGRNIVLIFVAIGAINWLDMARIVRGQTLSLKHREFVEAAQMTGASDMRIIRSHLLPHLMAPIIVYSTLIVASYILFEAALSFLGVGIQLPTASWGNLLAEAPNYYTTVPLLMLWPGIAVVMTTLAFNLLGDGLRDAFDPRSRL